MKNYIFNIYVMFVFSVSVFCSESYAETISVDEMYEQADIVAIVDASTVSYRIAGDKCVEHHLGKILTVYKGDVIVGKEIDLGFTRYFSLLTPERTHLIFMKNEFTENNDLDFVDFEGENIKNKYSNKCLDAIKYRFLWGDGRGQILFSSFKIKVTNEFASPLVAHLRSSIDVPVGMMRYELIDEDKAAYETGINLVSRSELLSYIKQLSQKKIKEAFDKR